MEGLCKFCQAPYPQATNKLSTRHQQVNIATNVLLISHTYPIDIPYLYRYGISMGYIWDIYGTSPCLAAGKPLAGGGQPREIAQPQPVIPPPLFPAEDGCRIAQL
jgi:hypothetical protein